MQGMGLPSPTAPTDTDTDTADTRVPDRVLEIADGVTDGVVADPATQTAGQRLAAARRQWGLSVAEAAQCLNLSAATITALEQDDYASLPGATYALGYLRAYAKLLKVDADEIADGVQLADESAHEIPYSRTPLRAARKTPDTRRPPKPGGMWYVVLLMIGILIGLAVAFVPPQSWREVLHAVGLSQPENPAAETNGGAIIRDIAPPKKGKSCRKPSVRFFALAGVLQH